ncbi:hypothetical protein NQ317_004710 [Molorchus minor]|uniref:Uncharacterized protein n=1 Tax=Molorchus minor TaxID=1323400 RepID=A0ABQ9J7C3_9CUCU|nr:hypothetical protein NQ317_004710 [Molorchus minor]
MKLLPRLPTGGFQNLILYFFPKQKTTSENSPDSLPAITVGGHESLARRPPNGPIVHPHSLSVSASTYSLYVAAENVMCGKRICNSAASLNVAISNIFVEFLWLLQIRLPHYITGVIVLQKAHYGNCWKSQLDDMISVIGLINSIFICPIIVILHFTKIEALAFPNTDQLMVFIMQWLV